MKLMWNLIQLMYYVTKTIILGAICMLLEALGGLVNIKTTNRSSEISKETIRDCRVEKRYSDDELIDISLDDYN